ncbi:restriction endonuclease [Roseibium aggregatum]|uniref:Restriction endonuclease type IV Mrr domain-containing protein n=1 Tax=Roseibium aggregatum TaxID=187304 RepID=A0A926NXB0_9HYPH|nr:restriction endonuclease [Roseibium aggregatum]MBD1546031.1 hypothetical protein [Roseibium aggregatum]
MNRELPWMPSEPVQVSPEEYEIQVVDWLKTASKGQMDFEVQHLVKLSGGSGEYTIDAVARFHVFGGAELVVLVECKRLKRPVEREVLITIHGKLKETGCTQSYGIFYLWIPKWSN